MLYKVKENVYVSVFMSSFAHCETHFPALSLSSGLSPLHLAVLRGHKDLSTMLLEAGADINAMVSPFVALTHQLSFTTSHISHLPSLHLLTFPMVLFFL